jgi:hypothetical protein
LKLAVSCSVESSARSTVMGKTGEVSLIVYRNLRA